MAQTVDDVITSARYDLRDTNDIEYADAELIDYLNRSVLTLSSALSSLNSDWVHASTDLTLSTGDNYTAQPSDCAAVRQIFISQDEVIKKSVDFIYQQRQFTSGITGKPYYFAQEGTNLVFERTADADYTLTTRYDQLQSTLTSTSSMPYNDRFNQVIREAVVLIAKHRQDRSVITESVLHDFFLNHALTSVIKRNFVPKRYVIDF